MNKNSLSWASRSSYRKQTTRDRLWPYSFDIEASWRRKQRGMHSLLRFNIYCF